MWLPWRACPLDPPIPDLVRGSQGQSHVQPVKFRRDSLLSDLRVQGGEASPGNATVQHPGVHVPAAQVAARGRDSRNGPGANYRGDAGRPEPVILEIPHWARQIVAQEQMRLLQQVLQPIGAAANQRQVGGKFACNCTYCFAFLLLVDLYQVLLPVVVAVKQRLLRREHNSRAQLWLCTVPDVRA